jgi:hypothetical protein
MKTDTPPPSDACPDCGGTNLSWDVSYQNNSGVVEGRLRTHDITCFFVLGCNECSGTVRVVRAEEIAAREIAVQPGAGRDWNAWLSSMTDDDWIILFAHRPDLKSRLQQVFASQPHVADALDGDAEVLAVLDSEIERQRVAVAAGRHDADAMAEFEEVRETVTVALRQAARYRFLRDSGRVISWNEQASFTPGYDGDARLMEMAIDNAIAARAEAGGES